MGDETGDVVAWVGAVPLGLAAGAEAEGGALAGSDGGVGRINAQITPTVNAAAATHPPQCLTGRSGMNVDGIPRLDDLCEPEHVPVGQMQAAVGFRRTHA